MSKEKRLEMFKILVNDCAGKEGASSADIEVIMSQQAPITHAGKCIGACVGEEAGIVSLR